MHILRSKVSKRSVLQRRMLIKTSDKSRHFYKAEPTNFIRQMPKKFNKRQRFLNYLIALRWPIQKGVDPFFVKKFIEIFQERNPLNCDVSFLEFLNIIKKKFPLLLTRNDTKNKKKLEFFKPFYIKRFFSTKVTLKSRTVKITHKRKKTTLNPKVKMKCGKRSLLERRLALKEKVKSKLIDKKLKENLVKKPIIRKSGKALTKKVVIKRSSKKLTKKAVIKRSSKKAVIKRSGKKLTKKANIKKRVMGKGSKITKGTRAILRKVTYKKKDPLTGKFKHEKLKTVKKSIVRKKMNIDNKILFLRTNYLTIANITFLCIKLIVFFFNWLNCLNICKTLLEVFNRNFSSVSSYKDLISNLFGKKLKESFFFLIIIFDYYDSYWAFAHRKTVIRTFLYHKRLLIAFLRSVRRYKIGTFFTIVQNF